MSRPLVGARVRALRPSETLALGARARELRARGEKVVSFAAGEPDFDTPVPIQEAAIEAVRGGHHRYTEVAGTAPLREAIVAKLRRDTGVAYAPKQIVVSNGAKHAIWNALFTVLEAGDEVLCPAPYWVSFPEMVRLAGGTPVTVPPPAGSYKVTAADVEKAITARTRLLILNSPNNPSGMVYGPEEVAALVAVAARHDLLILSDEIYERLVYGEARHTSPAASAPDRTILINGVSKTWAMTGWRIGYAAAPPEIAQGMERLQGQMTSNPAAVSQQAALAALTGDPAPADAMRQRFAARRDRLIAGLRRIAGLRLCAPDGAFYAFPDCSEILRRASRSGGDARDSVWLCDYLIDEAKVVCVPGAAFGMEGHLRLSYAIADADIDEGLGRIEAAFARL